MNAQPGSLLGLGLLVLLAGCNGEEPDPIRFEYAGTTMDTCAETDIGFRPDAAELTETAETTLFDTLDKAGTDCDGASVDITAYEAEEGEEIAYMRAVAVESAIVSNYDISDSRISKDVAAPPSQAMAGRVKIALMVEVPLEDE